MGCAGVVNGSCVDIRLLAEVGAPCSAANEARRVSHQTESAALDISRILLDRGLVADRMETDVGI